MKFHPPIAAVVALAWVTCATGALAHGYKKNGLEVIHPWIMETAGPNGAVSMTIKNTGKAADRLVGVSTQLADTAKLEAAGQAAGETAIAAVEIPAGGEAKLSGAGTHVLLAGLKKKLGPYDRLPLVLVFEKAGQLAIEVMVEEKEQP